MADFAKKGYLSILPIDREIEHTAGSAFAANPLYFDPENIVKLAIERGCNAIASTFGNLAIVSRNMREIVQVAEAFEWAHQLGLACILWCYTQNNGVRKDGVNYEVAADITGQANRLRVTIQADIIKQKIPENNGGFKVINFSKNDPRMYNDLASDHPIDLCLYQVINCYMGRAGPINSGAESKGETDLIESVKNTVINKRAGGIGLILGRKAFQLAFEEGVKFLHTIQYVYLAKEIDLA